MVKDLNAMNTYSSKIALPDISEVISSWLIRSLYGMNGMDAQPKF
jgi:hypothetical protein